MIRMFKTAALVLALASAPAMAQPAASPEAEAEAAMRALGDRFARGFFLRDADQVLSTVHPALSKVGVHRNYRGSGRDVLEFLPPGHLEVLGEIYNHDDRFDPLESPVEIDVLDTADGVGLMRIAAGREWYDYFLGVRLDGEWTLLNCAYGGMNVFANPDEAEDRAAIETAVRAYARAFDEGDYDALRPAIHTDIARRTLTADGDRVALETRESLEADIASAGAAGSVSDITVFTPTRLTGAARIDAADRTEWVLLQRLNEEWRIVNAFWVPAD